MGIVPVCEKLMEHEDEVICSASCSVVGALCKYSMLICEKFAAEGEKEKFPACLASRKKLKELRSSPQPFDRRVL